MDSYEKKYKEIVGQIKKAYLYAQTDSTKAVLENIFPELKESEDEKVRKSIIKFLIDVNNGAYTKSELEIASWIAWLEKQEGCEYIKKDWLEHIKQSWYKEGFIDGKYSGEKQGEQKPAEWHREDEQNLNACFGFIPDEFLRKWLNDIIHVKYDKSSDKVVPKFKVGDWVVQENIGVYKVIEVCESWYEVVDNKDKNYSIGFDKEYMCHLWTIQDAKDGDVLASNKSIFIFQEEYIAEKPIAYCGIMNGCLIKGEDACWTNEKCYPATKEQRNLLFQKIKDAGYKWDEGKKELRKIEKKPQRMISAEAKEAMYDKPTDNDMVEALRTEYEKGRADAIAEMQKELSEEDEYNFKHLMDEIVCLGNSRNSANRLYYDKLIKFLDELKNRAQPREEWCDKDEKMLDRLIAYFERRVAFTDEDNPRYASWLKSLRPQPKQEWSEEDECYMGECISAIATKDGWSFEDKRKTKHWLKSIKQRIGGKV